MSDKKFGTHGNVYMRVWRKQCRAVRRSGYLKGYPCGNEGKFECSGMYFCHAHIGLAQEAMNEPGGERAPKRGKDSND